ncbi:MAG: phosphate signaling complex protein PhoU [Spirochaetia bacterium]|nr:phosphate signaling complex protein PhoU [Spirochaetia bacterium]
MERHFDDELNDMKRNILKMATMVDESIAKAIKALVERNPDIAAAVEADDEAIDMLEIEVDMQCLALLARRQPIAIDLRFITSVQKINNDLERIADLAANIAHRAGVLSKNPQLKPQIDIPKMAELVRAMLKDTIAALVEKNTELARTITARDKEVDEFYVHVFREILTYMMEDNGNIKTGIEHILIVKHLERMADHVTNIAEDIVYMVEGKTIRHKFEK